MLSNEAATASHEKATAGRSTALRRVAARGYRWLLLGFLLLGVAQIFLAGLGVFSLQDQTLGGSGGDTAFAPHRAVGFSMAGVALLILLLALLARAGCPRDHRGGGAGRADLADAEPAGRARR